MGYEIDICQILVRSNQCLHPRLTKVEPRWYLVDCTICLRCFALLQVVLFLSRALADNVSFYCMVNCHLIDYEICKEIEEKLSRARDQRNVNYGIAFIYDDEFKDARIRAYLDKHLVKNHAITTVRRLTDYVANILAGPSSVSESACAADPNR